LAEMRFGQIRAALAILGMKQRVAAELIGIPALELGRAERLNAPVPQAFVETVGQLLSLAQRARVAPSKDPDLQYRAKLPFRRPTCRDCRCALYSVGTKQTNERGDFWYFRCPKCGRRYWSNDGRANPVNPRGGNWRLFKDRVRCPECQAECRVAASPSKRNKSRFWQCPKCGTRYRNIRGRAVPTRPGGRANVELSFLPSRKCPNCAAEHLFIKARPRPPIVKAYYFGCSHCGSSFRWNPELKRLIKLRRRKAYTRSKPQGGRPTGMSPERKSQAVRLVDAMRRFESEHKTKRGALKFAVKEVFAKDDFHSAHSRAAQILKDFRAAKPS
jgi:hypothetical protein